MAGKGFVGRLAGTTAIIAIGAAMLHSQPAQGQEKAGPETRLAGRSTTGPALTYDLQFSTYLGGSGGDLLRDMTVDAQGNIYVAGIAGSADFPRTRGDVPGHSKAKGGMVAKFSPTGKLIWSKAFTGEFLYSVKVDAQGNVVIAGSSSSTDYPVTSGALQPRNAGAGGKYPYDGVVSILSNDLSTLLYSSYIGGSGDEMARACCVGADGTLYVGGVTTSRDFPTKNAWQAKYGGDPGFGSVLNGGVAPVGWGNGDCWVTKFRPAAPGPRRRKVRP